MPEQFVNGRAGHENERLLATHRSGLPADILFEVETGVAIKDLESWMQRIETKVDDDRKEQSRFREIVLTDLGVIRTGYDRRFAEHDGKIHDLEIIIYGDEGLEAKVRSLVERAAREKSYAKAAWAAAVALAGVIGWLVDHIWR